MTKHLVIPDTQVKDGVDISYLNWVGQYIVHKKPDVIVMTGDFADMPSLSSYDKGTKGFEGRRYRKDIEAAHNGMAALMAPILDYNYTQRFHKKAQYKPRMVLTLGNHENRINRAVNSEPILEGTISIDDLEYEKWGWEVYPFLDVVEIDGVLYSHFFPRSANGRVMQNRNGAPTAKLQVMREAKSCTAGHMQGLDWHAMQTQDRILYGLIAGSCYLHDEEYLTPQGEKYWKGVIMKHGVKDGQYDPMFISLDYLRARYG